VLPPTGGQAHVWLNQMRGCALRNLFTCANCLQKGDYMAVVQLTDKDFEEKALKVKGVVFVDFYADWCGPCKMAAPVIDELAEKYKGKVVIGKVNVDENQATSGKYGVMSIPTVVMLKNGKEVDRMSGFAGKEGYEKLIKKVLGE